MKNELIHSPLFTCRIVEVARKEGEEEKKEREADLRWLPPVVRFSWSWNYWF
jgi:hypothetical protein